MLLIAQHSDKYDLTYEIQAMLEKQCEQLDAVRWLQWAEIGEQLLERTGQDRVQFTITEPLPTVS